MLAPASMKKKFARMITLGFALFYFMGAFEPLALGQEVPTAPGSVKPKKKASIKGKRKATAGIPEATSTTTSSRSQNKFGIGLGLFNFYPPQPTIEGLWRYEKWVGSLDVGTFGIGVGEFGGEASYQGIGVRYLFTDSFFVGAGLGKRHIVIATEADLSVNDVPYTIKWTRTTDQMTFTPKVGWESLSNHFSFLFSAGLLTPFATKFEVTRSMDTVPGLPQDELLAEQKKKGDDVRKVTTATMPYFETKVAWYF